MAFRETILWAMWKKSNDRRNTLEPAHHESCPGMENSLPWLLDGGAVPARTIYTLSVDRQKNRYHESSE